ncbi:MAG: type III-B CRISPR module RAMP protein Cmr4 [Candidatus Binatia bacterium]|nr:MAG: type III-B CRISPR module RAMP protein Cmr4 [Candidatus Binatia bacterium]
MAQGMFESRLLFMLAETPVHAGTGAELGAVDLPIQRERHTRFPTIHGSGVKGVLRDLSERKNGKDDKSITTLLFGSPPPKEAGGEALETGSLAVSDARLLLLPVRSVGHAFAWVTCPYLLSRFLRDAGDCHASRRADIEAAIGQALQAPQDKGLVHNDFPLNTAMIEEIELPVEKKDLKKLCHLLQEILPGGAEMKYWRDLLPKNLVIAPDDVFSDLALHGTEVVTRVRLSEETKTVEKGALWTEEYLPADSLLYSVLGLESKRLGRKWRDKKMEGAPPDGWTWVADLIGSNQVAQFGGKETIGRGFLRLHLWPEKAQ